MKYVITGDTDLPALLSAITESGCKIDPRIQELLNDADFMKSAWQPSERARKMQTVLINQLPYAPTQQDKQKGQYQQFKIAIGATDFTPCQLPYVLSVVPSAVSEPDTEATIVFCMDEIPLSVGTAEKPETADHVFQLKPSPKDAKYPEPWTLSPVRVADVKLNGTYFMVINTSA